MSFFWFTPVGLRQLILSDKATGLCSEEELTRLVAYLEVTEQLRYNIGPLAAVIS